MRPLGDRVCERCGKSYWANQAWQHEACVVVANKTKMVANTPVEKVANRHGVYKDKEARLKYMRELMRRRRAN